MGVKTCSKCGVTKKLSEFHRNNHNKDGYKGQCKVCCSNYTQANIEKKREYERRTRYKYRDKINEKARRHRETDGYKKRRAEWEKSEEKRAYFRAYTTTPEYRAKIRKYRAENTDLIRSRELGRERKYRQNPHVKIVHSLRARLNKLLRLGGGNKVDPLNDIIGCDAEFLRKHIESQFTKGMNWGNYSKGGWHIDHIIPCACFDLTDPEQQKQCFNFSNLQPLWAEDNLSKGSRYNGELIRKTVKG